MTDEEVLEIAGEAIFLAIQIGAPVLFVGLFVGVSIALLQALTQVQEITLVFVPKILAMFFGLMLLLPYMMRVLVAFTESLADRIIGLG